MDKQAIFMAREWVTKGLPTWDDCGFIPCPDAGGLPERGFLDATKEAMPLRHLL